MHNVNVAVCNIKLEINLLWNRTPKGKIIPHHIVQSHATERNERGKRPEVQPEGEQPFRKLKVMEPEKTSLRI